MEVIPRSNGREKKSRIGSRALSGIAPRIGGGPARQLKRPLGMAMRRMPPVRGICSYLEVFDLTKAARVLSFQPAHAYATRRVHYNYNPGGSL